MNIRIMSSNIWGDYFGNEIAVREDQLLDVYQRYAPDVLGMQEATPGWRQSALFRELAKDYEFVDTGRFTDGNYTPLVYRREFFDLVDSGFVQFEDTPDKSKSITWAVLEHKVTGKRFGAMSTHWWWKNIGKAEDDAIRVSNAAKVTEIARTIAERYGIPVFAFGDFNSRYACPSLAHLRENGWKFAQEEADVTLMVSTHHGDPKRGEDGLFHGEPTLQTAERSIDHIVYMGPAVPLEFRVVEDQDALDATDHSPIWCDFEI
ncbi:MAG: endonuclease/exonuclease/phosphatase family protein [Clostridia bacterium]|nr:endonuclease/exonuclease/phosphatase family protein [Clostridia bacterium]